MVIKFFVDGIPVPKARPRFTSRSGFVRSYTPKKTKDYEQSIIDAFYDVHQGQKPLMGSLRIIIDAYMSIPKGTSKKKREMIDNCEIRPIKRPDLDNIIKSVMDALNGVAYIDDGQIVSIAACKYYSDEPHTSITIIGLD
jgi:Holliday junction resolvase RusA-like endonuclease